VIYPSTAAKSEDATKFGVPCRNDTAGSHWLGTDQGEIMTGRSEVRRYCML